MVFARRRSPPPGLLDRWFAGIFVLGEVMRRAAPVAVRRRCRWGIGEAVFKGTPAARDQRQPKTVWLTAARAIRRRRHRGWPDWRGRARPGVRFTG